MPGRFATFVAALVLCANAAAQTDEPAPEQQADELERLVEKLENPEERTELIRDLELLLESQREAAAAQHAAGEPPGESFFTVLKEWLAETWESMLAVDPLQLAISASISLGILIAAFLLRRLAMTLLLRLYLRLTRGSDDESREEPPGAEDEKPKLPAAISRLVNLIIGVVAIALIAESWGAGVAEMLQTDLGSRFAETALSIGLILIVTVALWNASVILVERLLKLGSLHLDRDRTVRRLDTLVPLLSSALQVTISVFAGLLILSELGVNIGPLLAGAGILGLAVGFGAQTLVKDLITGVSLLLEDAATVGDVVEVAGHTGVVEEMRIRMMQLRDLSGIVYFIPYSDVTAVKNHTKDYSYYLFNVGVAYREDTDRVCEVLMEISKDLQSDADYGDDILEALQILGVDQFADSAVVIKARIMTRPGKQWRIGREFNRRMKKRFDEVNIEIPFPHTTVYFGEPKEGTAPPMHLALAGDRQSLMLERPGGKGADD